MRGRGQRVTLPRLLVHRHVRGSDRHVTPEQVHAELAPHHPGLSPATIYGISMRGLTSAPRRVRLGTPASRSIMDSSRSRACAATA
jgi:hypothetical protein